MDYRDTIKGGDVMEEGPFEKRMREMRQSEGYTGRMSVSRYSSSSNPRMTPKQEYMAKQRAVKQSLENAKYKHKLREMKRAERQLQEAQIRQGIQDVKAGYSKGKGMIGKLGDKLRGKDKSIYK